MATPKQNSPDRKTVISREPTKRGGPTSDRALRTHPRAPALAVSAALAPWLWQQSAIADPATNQLPTGGQVVSGSATITTTGNKLQVDQSSNKAILNWQTFSIGSGGWVNFSQPSSSAIALNRVLGNNPSEIFGRLTANGQVFLVNPSAVLFAPGASAADAAILTPTPSLRALAFTCARDRVSPAP